MELELTTEKICQEIISSAAKLGLTVATVESITGGRVASSLTGVSGASAVVKGGVVTYTDEIKNRVIGVPQEILDTVAAVSPECAKAMAEGGRQVLNVDIAVSITGFAGPAGPHDNHPVGTVYYGIATARRTDVFGALHSGDRPAIQQAATKQALLFLLAAINNTDGVIYSEPFVHYPLRQEFLPTKE